MPEASDRNTWATQVLLEEGRQRGFEVVAEYRVHQGRVDVVWLTDRLAGLAGASTPVPVAGFEIESSWRTRKHVKGDLHNLRQLGASFGVVVLLGEDPKLEGLVDFARELVSGALPRVVVWTEEDVRRLADGTAPASLSTPVERPSRRRESAGPRRHTGKYRPLWRWLRDNDPESVRLDFDDVEQILGFPLPTSCRKHPAHWSSYEGSAVARAIHDAGYRAANVDLSGESVTFVRS